MVEYLVKVATVWFLGFFPFFEIYVAVPAGMAAGLDPASVIFFSVTGNFLPVLLIEYGYRQLRRIEWLRRWLDRPVSEKLTNNINHYGWWYILLITPWVGVWAIAVAAKALHMNRDMLIWGSFISIFLYALVLTGLIALGIDVFSNDG